MKVYDLWLLNDSKACLFFLSDCDGDNELPLNPDGRPHKYDVSVSVFYDVHLDLVVKIKSC